MGESLILEVIFMTHTSTVNCYKKWHREIIGISTLSEIAVGSHFYTQHGCNTNLVILIYYGEASWSLLPNSVSSTIRRHSGTRNTYFCIQCIQLNIYFVRVRIRGVRNVCFSENFVNVINERSLMVQIQLINPIKKLGEKKKLFVLWTISRLLINQGWRWTFFPWSKTHPAWYQPNIS